MAREVQTNNFAYIILLVVPLAAIPGSLPVLHTSCGSVLLYYYYDTVFVVVVVAVV
jgi:hypothetical protein